MPTEEEKQTINERIDKINAGLDEFSAEKGVDVMRLSRFDDDTPTIFSDTRIRDEVIPDIDKRANELAETGQFVDNSGNLRNADGTIAEDRSDDAELFTIEGEVDEDTQQMFDIIDDLQASIDADTARQIRAIKAQYAVREEELSEINRRTERATNTALLLGGSSRFTTSGDQISAAQVRHGIMEIAELNAEEQSAIAAVKQAQSQKQYQLASKRIALVEEMRAEKIKKATELSDKIKEQNKKLRERSKQLATEGAIAEVLDTGITDPVQIFQALDGEVSFDEILGLTSTIGLDTENKDFTLGKSDIRFDSEGNVIARGSGVGGGGGTGIGGAATGVGGGTVGQSGLAFPTDADIKNMNAEERDFVNKVIRQLPTKLKDSIIEKTERQKEALFDFRRGRGIQEVVDEINGFIIQDEGKKPLANVLRRLSVGTGLELSEISAALNNNDPVKAMTTVENANLEKAEGELADVVAAQSIIKNSNRALSLLADAPADKLGAFDGLKFKLIDKRTTLTNEERTKVQTLETALVNLLNEIRRKSLGTAVTEAEVAFLEPLLASIKDQPDIIKAKLDELKVGTINNHNRARNQTALPEITESQLLDNKLRLQLYEELAGELETPGFGTTTNSDLINDILGNSTEDPLLDSGSDEDFWNNFLIY